jgi:hypothetical protein
MARKITTNGARTRTRSPKRKPPVVPTPAEITQHCHEVDVMAAAWVGCITAKVKELAYELGRLVYVSGHPEQTGAAAVLKTAIDMSALGQLTSAIDDAESTLEHLLSPNVSDDVPDLAGACRKAAAGLGLEASA